MQDAQNPLWVRREGVTPGSQNGIRTASVKSLEMDGDGATGCKGMSVHSLQPPLDGVFHASRHRCRFAEHPDSVGHCSRPAG